MPATTILTEKVNRFKLPEINKYPMAYALMVIVGVLTWGLNQTTSTNESALEARDEEIRRLREDNLSYRLEIQRTNEKLSTLYNNLLVKNGVIDKIQVQLDSMVIEQVKNKK